MRTIHQAPFPYEIQGKFNSVDAAKMRGWHSSQLWAVFEGDGVIGYAPPHVSNGASHFIVTNEHHDCATFYEEEKK